MSVRIFTGKRVLIATCVVTVFATATFGAAFNDLLGRDWRRLNGKDMQLLQKTMRVVLDEHSLGASADWEDPSAKTSVRH